MSAARAARRKLFWAACLGLVGTLGFAAASWKPLASRFATWRALEDARARIATTGGRLPKGDELYHAFTNTHAAYFRRDLFDRSYFASTLPASGVDEAAAAHWLVATAYYHADEARFNLDSETIEERVLQEYVTWLDPALASPGFKEALVNALAGDWTAFQAPDDQMGAVAKYYLGNFLFAFDRADASSDEYKRWESRCLDAVKDRHWALVLRDCAHEREKVRAGSLLLLYRHPSRDVFLEKAREGLKDPSQWVRLAAAGTMALAGDGSGAIELVEGLRHERWEVRWWSALGLARLERKDLAPLLAALGGSDPDAWVRKQVAQFARELALMPAAGAPEAPGWPEVDWPQQPPAILGLDAAALESFRDFVGGRGCVVRRGCQATSWGDYTRRGDVALAADPVYVHFLILAKAHGRIGGLDDLASARELALANLNPGLSGKDARITWRHLATRTSGYGVAEEPGAAFSSGEENAALFFELLFLKLPNASMETVNKRLLDLQFTDLMGCQDRPTFLAPGAGDVPGRLSISPRDFARFGLLYLRALRGAPRDDLEAAEALVLTTSPLPNTVPPAKGARAEVLPEHRSIVTGNTAADNLGSYSYGWWTNGVDREGKRHWPDAPLDLFAALGGDGRCALIVISSLGIVASWNDSDVRGREKENEAMRRLVAAVLK